MFGCEENKWGKIREYERRDIDKKYDKKINNLIEEKKGISKR